MLWSASSGLSQRAVRLPGCQPCPSSAQCQQSRHFFWRKQTGSHSVVQPAVVHPPYPVPEVQLYTFLTFIQLFKFNICNFEMVCILDINCPFSLSPLRKHNERHGHFSSLLSCTLHAQDDSWVLMSFKETEIKLMIVWGLGGVLLLQSSDNNVIRMRDEHLCQMCTRSLNNVPEQAAL